MGTPSAAVRALILTAGLGTRLRPLTYVRAKAAVPVNGEPLARRVIRWLSNHGIRDLVLNLHHHPASITAVVGDGSDLGVRVRYSWEDPVLGSAGGPRHALPLLVDGDNGRFVLVNGDTLTDVNIPSLLAAHAASGALVTMAVIPTPGPEQYGGVEVSADGFVTAFTRRGAPREPFHFVGVQVAEARAFAGLADGIPCESVGMLYPRLMRDSPRSVGAFVCGASFHDIGTPRDYLETSLALASVEGDHLAGGARRVVADSARVTRTALWDDVAVGARARLAECIVADGARIPDDSTYERCAIVPAHGRQPASDEWIEHGLLVRRF